MNPDKGLFTYWCIPASMMWTDSIKRIWVLFRKRVIPVGDTGWTTSPADDSREGPEKVAYRISGERRWRKWGDRNGVLSIDRTHTLAPEKCPGKEDVPEEEALAILLMTKR
jgi:hypothetical protein